MNENYIVINGKNPFDRVMVGEDYYIIDIEDNVSKSEECEDQLDEVRFDHVNYFNDKAFAKQVALYQLLYRKLLKFAYDNECEDIEWNPRHTH